MVQWCLFLDSPGGGHSLPLNKSSTSSKLLPFVSGSSKKMKIHPETARNIYKTKAPYLVKYLVRWRKVSDTRRLNVQLVVAEKELPRLLDQFGYISALTVQGTGPIPVFITETKQ